MYIFNICLLLTLDTILPKVIIPFIKLEILILKYFFNKIFYKKIINTITTNRMFCKIYK